MGSSVKAVGSSMADHLKIVSFFQSKSNFLIVTNKTKSKTMW